MKKIELHLAGDTYNFMYNDKELLYKPELSEEYIPFNEIVLDNGMWIDEGVVRKSITHKESLAAK